MTGAAGRIRWSTVAPVAALVLLVLTWHRHLAAVVIALVLVVLGATVLAAVHHAEVVAHRVGEPLGSLVLAVAVTIIEVGLIVTLMASGGKGSDSLARDTVFAAIMITCNGIVGVSLIVASLRTQIVVFHAEGVGGALATVATLATLSLVLPTFTTSSRGPTFTGGQLAFAAGESICLYALFVFIQTVRHREFFVPAADDDADPDHDEVPTARAAWTSVGLLAVSLVSVVGLAKTLSPTVESGVRAAGLPLGVVGVIIALLVLLPETLAAVRAARRGRIQTSLNLAYGSAIASIGLTIPAIAVASIWLSGPLSLGLRPIEMVLLAISVVVGVLTVTPGRATLLQGGVHLVLFAGFLVLAVSPDGIGVSPAAGHIEVVAYVLWHIGIWRSRHGALGSHVEFSSDRAATLRP